MTQADPGSTFQSMESILWLLRHGFLSPALLFPLLLLRGRDLRGGAAGTGAGSLLWVRVSINAPTVDKYQVRGLRRWLTVLLWGVHHWITRIYTLNSLDSLDLTTTQNAGDWWLG